MTHSLGRPGRAGVAALTALIGLGLGVVLLVAGIGPDSARAAGPKRLVLYSVAAQEQFVNNKDDETRGKGKNPFGNYKDLSPLVKGRIGPFPGDEALFSFNLYTGANLKTRAGSANFTCQYNFDRNAFCDASFQLIEGGTLMASGAFNFNAMNFALAVTGGYGTYARTKGVIEETPSAGHAQRLSFELV